MSAYLLAVVATTAAVGARWLLDPWLGDDLTLVTLFGAVAAVVWYGGWRPALFTALVGYLACGYFFVQPRDSFGVASTAHVVELLAYAASCCILIGFAEAMRTSQKRAEKNRQLLQVTFASIGDGVITTDVEGRVTYLNSVAESLTGWKQNEAAGQPLDVVFHIVNEQTRQTVENPVTRALREGTVVGLANHTVLITKDGSECPIDDSAAPIRDERGGVMGCVLVFRDITARRKTERAQALLAAIVTASDDAIVSKTLEGIILSWNAGAERLFGYTSAEAVGQSINLIIPPELRDEERSILQRLRRGERIDHFETVRITKDGKRVEISLTISPVRDEAGRTIGASKVARDITSRKRAEKALRESEERFRELANNIDQFVWTCDELGEVTWYNDRWYDYTGTTFEQTKGEGWKAVQHPDHLDRVVAGLGQSIATGEPWEDIFPLRGKDGTYRWFLSRAIPLRDENGRIVRWLGTNTDVTEQRQLEEALREADRRKDEFLATLAHELRNPLAPIRNAVQILLLQGPPNSEPRWPLEVIDRQVRQMARLLDDLLDVSRISHNKLELRKERIELSEVVQSAVETSHPAIDSGGHELTVDLPSEPIHLDADPVRLAQVLSNLLNNAAKYTNSGGHIRLTGNRQGSDVIISVKDDGIGIGAEALPRVFDMFSQGKSVTARSQNGLGIGLSLVQGIVDLHGGSIVARSDGPGRGSEFVIRLPGTVEPAIEERPARGEIRKEAPSSKPSVLVVDDCRDSADGLAMLLQMMGHDVQTANDGEAAIKAAAEFKPEVVLLDIGMPNMDGYEACRRIREQPGGSEMFLIAVTGWSQGDDRRRTEEAGFDYHLVKPVDPKALVEFLAARANLPRTAHDPPQEDGPRH